MVSLPVMVGRVVIREHTPETSNRGTIAARGFDYFLVAFPPVASINFRSKYFPFIRTRSNYYVGLIKGKKNERARRGSVVNLIVITRSRKQM